jgi:hypothetical protein
MGDVMEGICALPCLWFIGWVLICGVIGSGIGGSKNRSGDGFLLGALLGPIGWIIVVLMPHHYTYHCPYCDEGIRRRAIRCPHCRSDLREPLRRDEEEEEPPRYPPPPPPPTRRRSPPPPPPRTASVPQHEPSTQREAHTREDQTASLQSSNTVIIVLLAIFLSLILAGGTVVFLVVRTAVTAFDESKDRIAKAGVKTLDTAIKAHKTTHGDFPENLEILTMPIDKWPAALEETALIDPWGRPYRYDLSQRNSKNGVPLIYSTGPDPDNKSGFIRNW